MTTVRCGQYADEYKMARLRPAVGYAVKPSV